MVHIRYQDGTIIRTTDVDPPGTPSQGYGMRFNLRDVPTSFNDIASYIGTKLDEMAAGMRTQFTHAAPSEVAVEMGIAIEASGGIPVLVEAGVDCHFRITAKWVFDSAQGTVRDLSLETPPIQ